MPADMSLVLNSPQRRGSYLILITIYFYYGVFYTYCFVLTFLIEQQLSEDCEILSFLQVVLWDLELEQGKMIFFLTFSLFFFDLFVS